MQVEFVESMQCQDDTFLITIYIKEQIIAIMFKGEILQQWNLIVTK